MTAGLLCWGCAALAILANNGARLGLGLTAGALLVFVPVPLAVIGLALAGLAGSLTTILAEPHTAPKGPVDHAVSVATSLLWVGGLAFVALWVFGHHVAPKRLVALAKKATALLKRR